MVILADKGNATVMMDREEYDRKIKTLLNDGTYAKMKNEPMKEIERQVHQTLLQLSKKNELDPNLYRRLNPSYSHAPCLYGLPNWYTSHTYPYDPLSAPLDQPRMILPNI